MSFKHPENSFSAENWPGIINIARAGACAAIAIQAWEFLANFPDEVELIWSQRRLTTSLLYIWSRYIPLLITISDLVVTQHLYFNRPDPRICLIAIIGKCVSAQMTISCVELIMIIRVYYIYNRNRWVGYFLTTIYILGLLLEVIGHALIISQLNKAEQACVVKPCNAASLFTFSAGTGIIQGTLVAMSCFQSLKIRQWLRTPLTSLVLRDGLMIFVFLVALVSIIGTIEVVEQLPAPLWNAIFAWYISIMSIVGCRLVLSIHRLTPKVPRTRDRFSTAEPQFTSIVLTNIDTNVSS